jgi:dephospho-CoA kinase
MGLRQERVTQFNMQERNVLRFVGVTGLPGVGKGEFIARLQAVLQEKGITVYRYSLSDVLRAQVRKDRLPIERPVLHRIANELREKQGAGVLATMVADTIAETLRPLEKELKVAVIIDSIRTPEEITTLRERYHGKFVMIGLEAPIDILVTRIIERRRFDESADMLAQEAAVREMLLKESGQGEPVYGHSIAKCIEMADWRIQNTGSLDDLSTKIEDFVSKTL